MQCQLWWHGPEWLVKPRKQWPVSNQPLHKDQEVAFLRETKVPKQKVDSCLTFCLAAGEGPGGESQRVMELEKISKLTRLLRVTAWVLRAAKNWKQLVKIKRSAKTDGRDPLDSSEIHHAQLYWEKQVQKEWYADEYESINNQTNSRLCQNLGLYVDEDGILRCL